MATSAPPLRSLVFAIAVIALAFAGIVWYWPLAVFAMLLSAARQWYAAVFALGVALDLLYGAPIGPLHLLQIPFTLLALVLMLIGYLGKKFLSAGERRIRF